MNKSLIARTTIKGVELLKVGRWNSSTAGETEVTRTHLADMVRASTDKEVDSPVLKLGHVDPRFDGTPAAGWVRNLRLSEDGNSLYGDIAEIPSKLAAIIPTAFRRRSVEFKFGVKTPAGAVYSAALSGLALLGVTVPAVKGLEDILDVYASTSEATSASAVAVELSGDTLGVPQSPADPGDAKTGSGAPGGPADMSNLKGAPVAILEALKAKLGLPADATDETVEAALTAANVTAAPADGTPAAPQTPNPAPVPAATPAPGAVTPAAADPAAAPAAPAAPALSAPGTVTVSAVVFAEMQEDLKALSASSKVDRDRRNLDAALSAGRISPAEEAVWAKNLHDSEAATLAILSALPARYSTAEIGLSAAPAPTVDIEAELLRLADEAGI